MKEFSKDTVRLEAADGIQQKPFLVNDPMGFRKPLAASPLLVRVAPFVVFLALTFCQGKFGAASAYWFYLAKTLAGAWLIWEMRPFVSEMRWAVSWEAVVVGVAVFAAWVGITGEWTAQNSLWAKLA